MRLDEIEQRYDVVVASKLGRFIEHKDLSAVEAKARLNDLVGEYQSDMFVANPRADIQWTPTGEGAKLSDSDTGAVIFIYMAPKGLSEDISKDEFHRKLADPAAQELADWTADLSKHVPTHQFEWNVKDDVGTIRFTFDPFDDVLGQLTMQQKGDKTIWIINIIKEHVHFSDYWVWDTWDSKSGFTAYMIRK